MRFPWQRREKRDQAYSDEVVRLLLTRAQASLVADALQTLALEAAAGTVGRAFAAARAVGGIGPEIETNLEHVGRSFIRRGESMFVSLDGMLYPAANWTVLGRGSQWSYEVSASFPDGQRTFNLAASRVLHFRAAAARTSPWRGRGPMDVAGTGAALMGNLEAALANEAGGPHGTILPVPVNPEDDQMEEIKEAISSLAGRVFMGESQRTGWGDGDHRQVSQDWKPQRLGASPPAPLVELMVEHRRSVFASCGVPAELLGGGEAGAAREGWRRFLHGTLAPYGYIVERECAEKGFDVQIQWDRLRASDLTGRSRSYKQLVEAGMDAGRAGSLAGFDGMG